MMTATELVEKKSGLVEENEYSPGRVATDLADTIKTIQDAVEDSGKAIDEIEGRGFLKNVFSSNRNDLVTISRSQNKINELVLCLVRETMNLNLMSYLYLKEVHSELQRMVKQGWKDHEGRLQELSEIGESLAATTCDTLGKVIEGSRAIKEKVESNSNSIESLQQLLANKDTLDQRQSRDIANLESSLQEKSAVVEQQNQEIERLAENLTGKESLLNEQSKQLDEMRRLVEEQDSVDGQFARKLATLAKHLKQKETQDASRNDEIKTLNDSVGDLTQRADRLQRQFKTMTSVSISFGLGTSALLVGFGLVTFGVL